MSGSGWALKRFWDAATVAETEAGWAILLDGRPVRTPSKAPLAVPTRALADGIAAEWDAQEGHVDPGTMPLTRTANSAIDKVAPETAAVADMLAEYGATDLLCYRADTPAELVARQGAGWQPWLDWAAATFGARLEVATGVIPVTQDPGALAALAAELHALDPYRLSAAHEFVTLSGSLVLGLAVLKGALPPEEAWTLSRIDEDWQAEQWGEDEEAAEHARLKRAAFLDAARFLRLVSDQD
ncbi:ATP12 family chaperone protein [Wenxinia marina]|uniref:Chaperone n=1 Tax=Wenxinia marina DSM 24838 TaxID=1123501 RepID=A0A0D0NRA0_9RHOB|nr:ATP12 family protein [Wenxinia marina]KIQ70715.1 Chaperone [Wenxinia marina DSM 24838]GGL51169.1 ATPase [Wenxinia marina]